MENERAFFTIDTDDLKSRKFRRTALSEYISEPCVMLQCLKFIPNDYGFTSLAKILNHTIVMSFPGFSLPFLSAIMILPFQEGHPIFTLE